MVLLLCFILPTEIFHFDQCISAGNPMSRLQTALVKHVCVCFLQVRKITTGYDLWVILRQMSSSSVSLSCPPPPLKMSKKRQVEPFFVFLPLGFCRTVGKCGCCVVFVISLYTHTIIITVRQFLLNPVYITMCIRVVIKMSVLCHW